MTAVLAGLALFAGCSKDRPASLQPAAPPPPGVVATTPAPRSTAVPYDTPIRVDFAGDMDAATMTVSNVFLKLDTQRVPIAVSWDAALRRLTVIPLALLQLRKTYTVELDAGIRTAEGGAFAPGGWFFQFTTNAARRPTAPRPEPGLVNESPFVMMSWDSTEISAGTVSYEIWSGTDSAAVTARLGTPTVTTTISRWLPTAAWPLGTRVWWAITVVNASAGERLDGPAQSFTTLPVGTPEDSLSVSASDYGYNFIIGSVSTIYPYQFCNQDSVVSAGGIQGWMWFPTPPVPSDTRIASARLEVSTYDHYVARLPSTTLTLWSSKNSWPRPCRVNIQFPENLPNKDLPVATGRQTSGRTIVYSSDLLASHVEAMVRRGDFYGYEFVSTQRVAYVSPRLVDGTYHPHLKIHYYRTPPEPASALRP